MDLARKLHVLADAARFDAPCGGRSPARAGGSAARAALPVLAAASGTPGAAPVAASAIYESVAADGRRVPLLRLLLSNHCVHDCRYCPLRRSADPERARLAVHELVRVVMDHHRRGLIEGLFLSSAVDHDADHTMERMVAVVRSLRVEHHYLGYVHLKVVPEASPELIDEAGRWADRVSVNVELPTQGALDRLAPGRRLVTMHRAMDRLRDGIAEAHEGWRWRQRVGAWPARAAHADLPRFAPAGQVTQMVVGADDATDAELLREADALYRRQMLRRVYYGAFVPTAGQAAVLPEVAPPAARAGRLYQADHLLRFYGFRPDELAPAEAPSLAPDLDPKLAWALRHPEFFPVDVQRDGRERLVRVPGLGRQSVERILASRVWRRLRVADLVRMGVPAARVLPFVTLADHRPQEIRPEALRARFAVADPSGGGAQLELFGGRRVAPAAAPAAPAAGPTRWAQLDLFGAPAVPLPPARVRMRTGGRGAAARRSVA